MSKYILMTNNEVFERNIDEDDVKKVVDEYHDIEFNERLKKYNIDDLSDDETSELSDKLLDETTMSFMLVEDEDFRSKLTERQIDDYEFGDMTHKDIIKIAKKCDNLIKDFLKLSDDICEDEEYDF